MNQLNKVVYLLKLSKSKKSILWLTILLFLSMFFEFLGLGIMLPILSILISDDVNKWSEIIYKIFGLNFGSGKNELIIAAILFMVLFYIIKTLFMLYSNLVQAKFNSELTSDIQLKLFSGYLSQNYLYHLDKNSSQLQYNIQSEVNYLSHVTQALLALLTDISVIIGVFTMLMISNVKLAVFTTSAFLFFGALLNFFIKKKISGLGESREYHESKMYKNAIQAFGGVKDLIFFNKQEYFIKIFQFHSHSRAKVFVSQGALQQVPRLYYEFLTVIIISCIVFYYIFLEKNINNILPMLGLFMFASLRIMPTANRISASIQTIKFATPVVNNLFNELSEIRNNYKKSPNNVTFKFSNSIEIQNLSFKYPNKSKYVIEKLSLSFAKGQTVGFIGESGSGKSTLIDLFIGILKPTSGRILIDNIDIEENKIQWQAQIGYVSQSIYLLDETIRKNIAFGINENEIDEDKIKLAIKMAHLDSFVFSLNEGLDTVVGERGVKLSGGQRQRIGLARALYNDPPILVLDEATSALDSNTENEVMNAIRALKGVKTIFIIAHRTSTISHCDVVYEITNGFVSKSGSPSSFNFI